MTERKRITCPETGHLEEVELEHTPVGLVVIGCSRYRGTELTCPRECARRMDRRDRMNADDRERLLFVLANGHDGAAQIATLLAEQLSAERLTVEIAELDARSMPPLADYDAVVIGAHVRFGHHDRAVAEFIREHASDLGTLPAFFYSVGGHHIFHGDSPARQMTRRTGWHPTATWTFADDSASQLADVRAFARLVADEVPSDR
jgi:menaquinone-dependent protoporphyrinogen IX oxidase